jgi:hypothetical protein
LKGHDLSRAAKATKQVRALAPEGCFPRLVRNSTTRAADQLRFAALAIYTILWNGEEMRKVSIKGVLLGAFTDTISSSIAGSLAAFLIVLISHLLHRPREVFHLYGILWAILILIGFSFSLLGGYIAALVAKHDELLNGGLSSFLCVGIGVIFIMTGKSKYPVVVQWLQLAASTGFAILGGYLRLRQKAQYATEIH